MLKNLFKTESKAKSVT